jgi:hypothetical protein
MGGDFFAAVGRSLSFGPRKPHVLVARALPSCKPATAPGRRMVRIKYGEFMIPDPTLNNTQNPRAQSTFDESRIEQCRTLRLDLCPELEWITVKTQRSTYDIVVLSGAAGAVAVRGGAFLPEFRSASFIGSLSKGIATNLGAVVVGLNLEFVVHGQSIITSPVQSFSRVHLAVVEGQA